MAPRPRIHERRSCWECRGDFIATAVDVVFCAAKCGNRWRARQARREQRLRARPLVEQGFAVSNLARAGRK